MLEWVFAVLILIAAAVFWHLASGSQSENLRGKSGRRNSGRVPSGGAGPVVLMCKPSALAKHLRRHCPAFRAFPAAPRWTWRASPLLQTAVAALRPCGRAVRFARDHLQVRDGGLVSLDWALAGQAPPRARRGTGSDPGAPVLLIVPSSFGKVTWSVLKLCELGLTHGYAPVVFNRRGQNGTPLATPRLQSFGDAADLREALRYVRYRRPAARLYAASEGSGSGLLLSYLGECGSSSHLTCAACLSPLLRGQAWYDSAPRWPYSAALLLHQKICLSRYKTALGEAIRTDAVFSCSTLRGLEEALFCQPEAKPPGTSAGREGGGVSREGGGVSREGGGVSWEEYWERNEPLRDVDEVAVPVLCVCSRDDPVRGEAATTLPFDLFHSNPHLFLLLTEQGGHCGFSEGGGGGAWGHRALLEFFRAVTDFFASEERAKAASHRRGLRGGASGGAVTRGNSRGGSRQRGSISTCKQLPACSHSIHSIYSWQRSYTR
ncbi:protein ABHD15-like [Conger conger]|uniref:protein ABHD15-like n=1 Tax=Conger conger TaxID=82655 RepID=UPI002A59878C|nr:protein ABHD15-like [Conger conger]